MKPTAEAVCTADLKAGKGRIEDHHGRKN